MMITDHYVKFWGVRGSHPVPGPHTQIYGGNTACVEVVLGDTHIIIDLGSGAKPLGDNILKGLHTHFHILFSHYHWDHVMGIPFFRPFFYPSYHFNLYGPKIDSTGTPRACIDHIMSPPHFPITANYFRSGLSEHILTAGETRRLADSSVHVTPALMNHSPGTLGYRIEGEQRVVAYASDTEHPKTGFDESVMALAMDADIFIYDAMYTEDQYDSPTQSKVGWGHSTWEVACEIAKKCRVKTLVLFHHNPIHHDDDMEVLIRQAQQRFPSCVGAQEGLELPL